MKSILGVLLAIVSAMSAVPALAGSRNPDLVQTVGTLLGVATTDPNVVNLKPDQMVKVAWEAPFIRFPQPERLTVDVTVLQSGGHGQMMNQIAVLLAGMSRTCWTEHQQAKNTQVFTGKPNTGNLIQRQVLSYVVGQNSNQSASEGSSGYNSRNTHSSDSHSDSQSSTTQESYVNLHTELVRIGEGGQDEVLYAVPNIQAYENGLISASWATSGSNSSDSNGSARDFSGFQTHPSSYYNRQSDNWSWQNSSQLLEAKSAQSLAQYLANGAYALLCQQIKAEQALATQAAGTISVDRQTCVDLAKNLATKIHSSPDASGSKTIAVARFQLIGSDDSHKPANTVAQSVAEDLTTALADYAWLSVVERSQLDKSIESLKLDQSGYIDNDTAKKLGRMVSADYVLIGSISDRPKSVVLNARVIDVETARVKCSASAEVAK